MVHGRVVIETDLEPDDVLVIAYCLLKLFRREDDVEFIVGEGDSRLKRVLLIELFKALGLDPTRFRITQGLNSSLPYPTTYLKKEWLLRAEADPVIAVEQKLENYLQVYKIFNPNLVFFLKPPREALVLIDKIDFSKTVCRCYGGFNYRVTGASVLEINKLTSKFKEFWHFSRKSELDLEHHLYDFSLLVSPHHRFGEFLRVITYNWNVHYSSDILKIQPEFVSDSTVVIADMLCAELPLYIKRGSLLDFECISLDDRGTVMTSAMENKQRHVQIMRAFDGFLQSFL